MNLFIENCKKSFIKYILLKTVIITSLLLVSYILTSLILNETQLIYRNIAIIVKLAVPINLLISSLQYLLRKKQCEGKLSKNNYNFLYVLIIGVLGFGVNINIGMTFWVNIPLVYSSIIFFLGGLVFGVLMLVTNKISIRQSHDSNLK